MQHPPQQPAKKSNVWKIVLGVGCAMILLLGALCVGGTYFLAKKASEAFVFEPAKVEELAGKIIPGARPIDDYHGVMGMELIGIKMAVIGPQGWEVSGERDGSAPADGLAFIAFGFPNDMAGERGDIEKQVKSAIGSDDDGEVVKKETVKLKVGGQEMEALKVLSKDEEGEQFLEYTLVFPGESDTAILLVIGDSEKFEHEAMDAFLANLSPPTDSE